MEELTLTTLDHLVLRAKQIKEISDDFSVMRNSNIVVCTFAGTSIQDSPELQIQRDTFLRLSMLANQRIMFEPLTGIDSAEKGFFYYSGVKFFALFSVEEMEAYRAES